MKNLPCMYTNSDILTNKISDLKAYADHHEIILKNYYIFMQKVELKISNNYIFLECISSKGRGIT